MTKKHLIPIITFLLCTLFCGCSTESTKEVSSASTEVIRTIGPSEIYTEEEINAAMDAMEVYFTDGNSTLTEIIYDEAFSLAARKNYEHQNGNENPLLILTTITSNEAYTEKTEFGSEYIPAHKERAHHWVAEYANETWWIFDSYYECAPYPFAINPDEVTEVAVGNGSNGDHKVCTEKQAEEIIAMINEFHCKEKNQTESADGWTYGIRITKEDGDSFRLTIRDESTIETETFIAYTAAEPNYFSEFLETWY